MEYDELKEFDVAFVVLPSSGYRRFFQGELPPPGTPAHYYVSRNRTYLSQFLAGDDSRYQQVASFEDHSGSDIRVFRVM